MASVLSLTLIGIFLSSFSSYPISLPQQIGRINDYGNVLTREDREELARSLQELAERGIRVNLLISLRDPYRNPNLYTSKIRAKWGIRGESAESLIVFVKESDGWKLGIFLTPAASNLFSPEGLTEYREKLEEKAEAGEIRTGSRYAINHMYVKAYPPARKTEANKEEEEGLPWIYIASGVAGGIILLGLGIRWEAMHRCPRCGSRLKKTRMPGGESQGGEKHCPECGYRE